MFLSGSFPSTTLGFPAPLRIVLPDSDEPECQGVLFLLHGLTDDGGTWGRKTDLQDLSNRKGLLIVCPEGHRSFWMNRPGEPAYRTFLTTELPRLISQRFRVPPVGERWSIAGLSMGGYGALMAAANAPDIFGNVGAFSPVTSVVKDVPLVPPEMLLPSETNRPGQGELEENLAFALLNLKPENYVMLSCGTEDFFAESNAKLHAELARLGVVHEFSLIEGVGHEWDFWTKCLDQFIEGVYS